MTPGDEIPGGRIEEPNTLEFSTEELAPVVAAATGKKDRCMLTMLAGPTPGSILTLDTEEELVLGRDASPTGNIQDPGLSRRHARLFRKEGAFYIEDLGSTNGTFVGGKQLHAPQLLREGDRIQMGRTVLLRFQLQDAFEQEAARRLYELAVRDPLTHTHNRRYFDERLQGEFAFAARHATKLSLLMLDVDHFKKVNDTFGHPAGDAVLRVVAATMQRILRTENLLARYGGEEFCVIARGIDSTNAMILAERLRRTLANLALPWEGDTIRITVSVGIATLTVAGDYPSGDALVAAADEALYAAKEGGRNRCVRAENR